MYEYVLRMHKYTYMYILSLHKFTHTDTQKTAQIFTFKRT